MRNALGVNQIYAIDFVPKANGMTPLAFQAQLPWSYLGFSVLLGDKRAMANRSLRTGLVPAIFQLPAVSLNHTSL